MAEHSMSVMRVAADGELYSYGEFQAYYLEAAEDMWQRATHIPATEHDVPHTLTLQSSPEPCVPDAANNSADTPNRPAEQERSQPSDGTTPQAPSSQLPEADEDLQGHYILSEEARQLFAATAERDSLLQQLAVATLAQRQLEQPPIRPGDGRNTPRSWRSRGGQLANLAAANPANISEHNDVNAVEGDLPPPSIHVVDMQAASSTTQPAATEHNFREWI